MVSLNKFMILLCPMPYLTLISDMELLLILHLNTTYHIVSQSVYWVVLFFCVSIIAGSKGFTCPSIVTLNKQNKI